MRQLILTKINPFLLRTYRQSLISQIIIEGRQDAKNELVNILDTLKLPIINQTDLFNFVSTISTPEIMMKLITEKEVLMLHADIPKYALAAAIGLRNPLFIQPPIMAINQLINPLNFFSPEKLMALLSNLPVEAAEPKRLEWEKEFTSVYNTRNLLGADQAEIEGFTGRNVKVAVIDTGVDLSSDQVDNVDSDNVLIQQPNHDENGHGTHVFSTAIGSGAINLRSIKLKGVAPDADKVSIKCLGGLIGTGTTMDVIKAMELAYVKGAKVISMSLGSNECQGTGVDPCQTCPECRTVKAIKETGVIFVIAAGNSGSDPHTIGCPGCSPDALTIGAYDPITGKVADFSSRGSIHNRIKPDVIAPGVNIYASTSRGSLLDNISSDKFADGYTAISGTSMATPHVSGLVALLVQKFGRELTVDTIKKVCEEKGSKKNNDSGWGKINWSWF